MGLWILWIKPKLSGEVGNEKVEGEEMTSGPDMKKLVPCAWVCVIDPRNELYWLTPFPSGFHWLSVYCCSMVCIHELDAGLLFKS